MRAASIILGLHFALFFGVVLLGAKHAASRGALPVLHLGGEQ